MFNSWIPRMKKKSHMFLAVTDFYCINTPTIRNNLKQQIWEHAEFGTEANNMLLWAEMSWLQKTTRFPPQKYLGAIREGVWMLVASHPQKNIQVFSINVIGPRHKDTQYAFQ